MERISVLVAVYNAEKTLRRCLDSLIHQTLGEEVQIICIDDASTDASLAIIREYEEKYNNVDVVALKKNRGQAHARNQGIPLVRGFVTTFLDSDDYLAPDALEQALIPFEHNSQTDAVLFNLVLVYPDGTEKEYSQTSFECISGYDAFTKALSWDIHGVYVARSELYKQFPYDETCYCYSDDNTTMTHYLHSKEVRCCTGKYYYVQHDESCTHQINVNRFEWIKANMNLHKNLVKWSMPKDIINIYEKTRWNVLLGCFWFYHRYKNRLSKQDRDYALTTMHEAWKDIDTRSCLPPSLKYKPGYMPLKWSWTLFRWQEWMLYMLRKLKYDKDGNKKR